MDLLHFDNPVFRAYALVASAMVLLAVLTAWLTVYRMMKVKGGFRSPEDLKKTPLNPAPSEDQLSTNEYVDRTRRMMANHGENIPYFLGAGLLYVLSGPDAGVALLLMYTYGVTRLLHFFAYLTAQVHDVRATFWTIGSAIILYMAGHVLLRALG